MKIKVKGSYESLRHFCKAVKVGVHREFELLPSEETMDYLYDDLIEMFSYNAHYLSVQMPIPLDHIEIWSDDEADDEMVEWIKTEPNILAQVVFIHFAEQILDREIQKYQDRQVA